MRRFLLFVLLMGCEPNRRMQAEDFVRGLQDIHEWHPVRQAAGFYAYDETIRLWDEAVPVLVENLTNGAPTKIMEFAPITVPTVGDVCFHILLLIFNLKPEAFREEGVVVLPEIGNPIFAVRFDAGARQRVQDRFSKMQPK